MTFPCVGPVREWHLRAPFVAKLREAYPFVDVEAECRVARMWCEANRPKRKTARGMEAFLVRWMTDKQNRGGRYQGGQQAAAGPSYRKL